MRSQKSLALTHWVGTPKIGEHLLSQDIHSVLHSGGVKIKISGSADPTPSLQEDPPVRGPTNKLARATYFLLQFARWWSLGMTRCNGIIEMSCEESISPERTQPPAI